MTVVAFKIPDSKLREVSKYVTKAGGKKVSLKQLEVEDMEVTHEVFFGENIKRLFRALSNK